jgi:hypothetical protein
MRAMTALSEARAVASLAIAAALVASTRRRATRR